MRITVIPQAVSWKNRTVKVAGEWAVLADSVNLKQIRIGLKHDIEVQNTLSGNKQIERIYHVESTD